MDGFRVFCSPRKIILGCRLIGKSPGLGPGHHCRFDACHPNNSVRNSVVEAHSDEMVVDGSSPSVPTNVAHKV